MSDEQAPCLVFDLHRDSAFSFACRACGRCCRGKIILVGPHEILGMARVLGIGTTEFLARYTREGGTALKVTEDGRCVFVGPEGGCRVHPRRPLVCRLYPLGRRTDEEGRESFALYGAHPGCEAVVGREGTIAEFLESQGVGPYIEWSNRYSGLYVRMIELMRRTEPEPEPTAAQQPDVNTEENSMRTAAAKPPRPPSKKGRRTRGKAEPEAPDKPGPPDEPVAQLSPWLDIDASLAEYCAARGLTPPADIDAAIDLHIRAMEEWLEGL